MKSNNIKNNSRIIYGFEINASAETQCSLEFEGISERQYAPNISCGLQATVKQLEYTNAEIQKQIEHANEWCKKLGEDRDNQKKLSKARNDLDAFYYWSESSEIASFVDNSCSKSAIEELNSAKSQCEQLIARFSDYSIDQLTGHVLSFEKIRSEINTRLDKRKELDDHFYDAEIDALRGIYLPEDQKLLSEMVTAYKAKNPKEVSFDSEIQAFLEWRKKATESKKQHSSQISSKEPKTTPSQTELSTGTEASSDGQSATPAHEEL